MSNPRDQALAALEPCPWCEGPPKTMSRGVAWGVGCSGNQPSHFVRTYGGTEAEAVDAWNRHAALTATQAALTDEETGKLVDRLVAVIALFDQGVNYDIATDDGTIIFTEADHRQAAARLTTQAEEIARLVEDNEDLLKERREAIEKWVAGRTEIARLRGALEPFVALDSEDHARGCQGRDYECTCGFDVRLFRAVGRAAEARAVLHPDAPTRSETP